MNKLAVIGVITGLVLGFVTGLSVTQLYVQNLQNQVDSLMSDKMSLQSQVDSLQVQITSKDEVISELQSSYVDLLQKSNFMILGIYFSPHGGAANQVIDWIDRANKTIHVLIYSFTNDDIGEAVVRAYSRGVEVKVVFEKNQVSKYSEYWRLDNVGISIRNDTNSGLMHHKVAIIDDYIVLVGSFNWSVAAENRNNENLIIISSDHMADALEEEFKEIWGRSV